MCQKSIFFGDKMVSKTNSCLQSLFLNDKGLKNTIVYLIVIFYITGSHFHSARF